MSAADAIAEVVRELEPFVRDRSLPGFVAAVSIDSERAIGACGMLAFADRAAADAPTPADRGEADAPVPADRGEADAPAPADRDEADAPAPADRGEADAPAPANRGDADPPASVDRGRVGAMRPETLFRVASLSKLVGAALTLSLAADGVVSLREPVARWLPELALPRVLRRIDGPLHDSDPAAAPIVVEDLLTMTAGFGLVLARGPLQDALRDQGLMPGPFAPPFSHDEFMRRLGGLPLAIQPGSGWLYHTPFDALSVLLARAAGRPLSELLQQRITGPLAMHDTAFWTDRLDRLATAYQPRPTGLVVLDLPRGPFSRRPRFEAFGSGLVSTAPDLLTFLETLLDGGRDVLGADAVALMCGDRLDARQRGDAQAFLGAGRSWGFGGEVALARERTAVAPGGFGWMGGTGTTAYIDPDRRLAAVLLTQRAMESNRPPEQFVRFWEAVYRAC